MNQVRAPFYMKFTNKLTLLLVISLLASVPASAQSKKEKATPAANIFATVGDSVITKETYEQALKEALASGRPDSAQLRAEVRNILINQELVMQEALKQGLDKKPEHRRALQNLRQNYLVQTVLRDNLQKNPITDDQLRQEYEQRFGANVIAKQSEYKLSTWMLATEKEALLVIERLSKGESIDKIDKALGIRKEQRPNQDSWIAQTNLVKPLLDVIIYLSKGGHTIKPIPIANSWYVVRIEDQRPMRPPSFEEAKQGLMNILIERKQSDYLSRLRTNTTIQINP